MSHRIACLGLAAAALLAAGSCGPTAGTRRPDWSPGSPVVEQAMVDEYARALEPCHLSSSAAPRKRAFGAAVLALQERAWVVTSAEAGRGFLRAEKCYRNQPGLCATVEFQADAAGALYVKPEPCRPNLSDDLERWLIEVEDTYAKYRCYTDDALRDEMKKLGIAL